MVVRFANVLNLLFRVLVYLFIVEVLRCYSGWWLAAFKVDDLPKVVDLNHIILFSWRENPRKMLPV